ncbi:MAG: DUF4139 domain-containing protein [Gemmatimonadales bacterium]
MSFMSMVRGRWLLAAGMVALGVAGPVAAQTSLTIYSDGRVLHRRTLPVRLPAGISTHEFALGTLDASSIFALDSGVAISGLVFDPAIDQDNALRRAVGRDLRFATRGAGGAREVVTARVLGVDPERYRLDDGTVVFERPGTPLFPADLVPAEPSTQLTVRSERSRNTLGLGFFSDGAAWRASYSILLGRSQALVSGQALIMAGRLRADSAEIQVLAGNVGQAAPQMRYAREGVAAAPMAARMDMAKEESVGEAHLYSLPGRFTLLPGVETAVALFDPVSAAYERTYTVRGQLPWVGGLPQYGDEQTEPVAVTYVVKRAAKTVFGDRPMPGGVVRLYERDQQSRLQLVGESSLDHTAAGQDLRLSAGTAFDLTARRIQTAYQTQREGQRTVATASYTVTVANAKDSAATVDVLEERRGEWSVSSTITRFRLRVPAKGEATVTYRVRVVW